MTRAVSVHLCVYVNQAAHVNLVVIKENDDDDDGVNGASEGGQTSFVGWFVGNTWSQKRQRAHR